ncbi:helix-turn-helix transcriptional regulator [Bacillus sp. H-16]|uniref:helix-turn-helix transcriptional regulator n=1 Tax=Alteribacter salitolerans TaxID=2912333 RepID=UPI0019622B66|nr:helix-turn-helix transcriptional regulator [Alteribacter salitolerans]MBM7097840.1 helix-turn-helix transcriptional regulator [Alteribacter salitolerans]
MKLLNATVPPLPVFIKGGKGSFKKGQKHFARTFEVFDLLIVEKGTLYMKEEESTFSVKSGEYLMLAPGMYHGGFKGCEEPTTFFWVHFSFPGSFSLSDEKEFDWSHVLLKESTFTEPAAFSLHLPRYGEIKKKERLENLLEHLSLLNHSQSPVDKMKQQTLFYESLLLLQEEAIQIPTSAETVAEEAMHFIKNHFRDSKLTLGKVAKELLYHPDYVTRCLKRVTGLTPVQYISRYRLEVAKDLLITTNMDLGSVCLEVGIQDRSYFSRLFKKIEGVTPGEFRRMRTKEAKKNEM